MFTEDCITNRQTHHYAKIPADTDMLITHSPAYGILDFDDGINYGSEEILMKLSDLHLKAHLFGHIHPTSESASLRSYPSPTRNYRAERHYLLQRGDNERGLFST